MHVHECALIWLMCPYPSSMDPPRLISLFPGLLMALWPDASANGSSAAAPTFIIM